MARQTLSLDALLALIGAAAFAVVLSSVADLDEPERRARPSRSYVSWQATSNACLLTLRPAYGDTSITGRERFLQPSQAARASFEQQATGPHLRRQGVWDVAVAHQRKTPASRYRQWAPAATTCAASSTILERYEASLGLPHARTTSRASSRRDCRPKSWVADSPTRVGVTWRAPRGRSVPAPGAAGPRRYGQSVAGRGRAVTPTRRP
jgi:hypothetical protein